MEQQHIDELLQRYLGLLDEYTQLRQSLSQLQSGVYQNIARANFSGERGMRYGPDHYDERMQATRILSIEQGEDKEPVISVIDASDGEQEEVKEANSSAEESHDTSKISTEEVKPAEKKRKKNKNPLHWFGLFAPMPLRTAQTQSVQAVEDIIPRLVSVNAEMLNVEIEVRRARKRRAKAEAVEGKN
ncbi:vacuolar ATPase assembly VMA22 [Fusarium heterosporum]|uniref:Vacuolar ATPase assembly protein VMA22 n=1 Tax=Fusarium heterosporum TaxID=42747 RepID=A0A8H5T3H5_FUSHE|nr:vacuolar ATPase assembly VMA22 [Fusarium heterosporum]